MSVTTENSAGASAIRPFTIKIPEAEIKALRARIAVTRWPEKGHLRTSMPSTWPTHRS